MNRVSIFLIIFIIAIAGLSYGASNATFDQMKNLVGNWRLESPEGKGTVTIDSISGGTALMENMEVGKEQMVTTYYPDGATVMMTHFCMANNQPRMKATDMSGKTLNFAFVDATNLPAETAGHMKNLALTIESPDHVTETWTWSENGKEKVSTFHLYRVK